MLATKCTLASRARAESGQAIVELLPSVIIFFLIMGAGLSYFRVMRAATIRQEVVRNLAFAKIDYSGTLTTPLTQKAGIPFFGLVGVLGNANVFIDRGTACFRVNPDQLVETVGVGGTASGIGGLRPVDATSYAVVYRAPAGDCF